MIIKNINALIWIPDAEENNKLTNKEMTFFSDFIYLGKNDSPDNYEEVGREIWKHFIEGPDPDVVELQAQTKDINGMNNMAQLYVVMIQRGLIKGETLEEQLAKVPVRYREQVRALLEAVE